jgi:hypothetical protein
MLDFFQPQGSDAVNMPQHDPLNGKNLDMAHHLMVKAWSRCLLSANLCDNEEFRQFIQFISFNAFSLPHRTKLSELLNQAYVAKVELVCFLAGVVVAAAAVI